MTFRIYLVWALVCACSHAWAQVKTKPVLVEIEPHVYLYKDTSARFNNSIVLEGEQLTIINTQATDAQNKAFITAIREKLGTKKVSTIVVTDGNISKFIGIPVFERVYGKIKVVAPLYIDLEMNNTYKRYFENFTAKRGGEFLSADITFTVNEVVTTEKSIAFSDRVLELQCLVQDSLTMLVGYFKDTQTLLSFDFYNDELRLDPNRDFSMSESINFAKELQKQRISRVIGGRNAKIYTTYDFNQFFHLLIDITETNRNKIAEGLDFEAFESNVNKTYGTLKMVNGRNTTYYMYNQIKSNDPKRIKSLENPFKKGGLRQSLDNLAPQ